MMLALYTTLLIILFFSKSTLSLPEDGVEYLVHFVLKKPRVKSIVMSSVP